MAGEGAVTEGPGGTGPPPETLMWSPRNIALMTLAVWIIVTNMSLIKLVVMQRVLRRQFKNLLALNIAVADLLLGAFVLPALLCNDLFWDTRSCGLSLTLDLMYMYFHTAVVLLAVVGVGLERFVNVFLDKPPSCLGSCACASFVLKLMYVALPWVTGGALSVPLFLSGVGPRSPDNKDVIGECLYSESQASTLIGTGVTSYLVPASGVLAMAIVILVKHCRGPHNARPSRLASLRRETTVLVCALSFLSAVVEFPAFVINALLESKDCRNRDCGSMEGFVWVALWVHTGRAVVFPFLWLLYRDIRAALLCRRDSTKIYEIGAELLDRDSDRPLQEIN